MGAHFVTPLFIPEKIHRLPHFVQFWVLALFSQHPRWNRAGVSQPDTTRPGQLPRWSFFCPH